MWVLSLNDMRSSNVENVRPVCRAETKQELVAFIQRETVYGYRDGQWGKVFRKGGPLEWFNPPWDDEAFCNVGTREDWQLEAGKRYDAQVLSLPPVTLVALTGDAP